MSKINSIISFFWLALATGCVIDNEVNNENDSTCETGESNVFRPEGKLGFTYFYIGNNTSVARFSEHLYDKRNRLTKILRETEFAAQEFHQMVTFTYDELDCLVWERRYDLVDGQSKFNHSYERIFDAKNRPVEVRIHRADGTEDVVNSNSYDDVGNLVEKEFQGGRIVYTHFEDGRVATMQQIVPGAFVEGHLYRYDDRDRLVAKEYFMVRGDSIPESGLGNIEEFEYDEKDRLIEKRNYSSDVYLVFQGRTIFEYY